jgi:peptidoglycan/LPS O-acetylase OafA/YrhL
MFAGGFRAIVHTLHTFPFALVSIWIVDRGARDMLPRLFDSRWLASVGVISYGAYVMHRYVMHYLGFDGERGLHVFFPVLVVSLGLAAVTWRLFERPLNDMKRFWPYVRRAPAMPQMAAVVAPAHALAGSDTASVVRAAARGDG